MRTTPASMTDTRQIWPGMAQVGHSRPNHGPSSDMHALFQTEPGIRGSASAVLAENEPKVGLTQTPHEGLVQKQTWARSSIGSGTCVGPTSLLRAFVGPSCGRSAAMHSELDRRTGRNFTRKQDRQTYIPLKHTRCAGFVNAGFKRTTVPSLVSRVVRPGGCWH